jgi:hypothetical protein
MVCEASIGPHLPGEVVGGVTLAPLAIHLNIDVRAWHRCKEAILTNARVYL